MAIYNYRCHSCNEMFERLYSMDDRKIPENEPCPSCGEMDVHQSLNSFAVGYNVKPSTMKVTDDFNSRMKEIKKRSGRDNTMSGAIR